jgi:hypothetical protein
LAGALPLGLPPFGQVDAGMSRPGGAHLQPLLTHWLLLHPVAAQSAVGSIMLISEPRSIRVTDS